MDDCPRCRYLLTTAAVLRLEHELGLAEVLTAYEIRSAVADVRAVVLTARDLEHSCSIE